LLSDQKITKKLKTNSANKVSPNFVSIFDFPQGNDPLIGVAEAWLCVTTGIWQLGWFYVEQIWYQAIAILYILYIGKIVGIQL
jgi:hypothetical protein